MLLSLIKKITECQVVRDCEVDSLGLATSYSNNKKVLSFLADKKFLDTVLENNSITALICTEEIYNSMLIPAKYGLIIAIDPKIAFYDIHNKLAKEDFYWKHFKNKISDTARISDKAIIGEDSIQIGDNVLIEAGVVVHPGSIIGNNVIIRSGTQVGSSGFQFVNNGETVFPVKTAGRLIISDYVEVQHNCCIDRGIMGDTVLDKYVKLDNFVHIAHDNFIGRRTFITAGVKLAGRVVVGKDCWLGVNATVSNGISIGDNCRISLGSVVTKDVPSNSTVSGNFAISHERFIKFIKSIK
ncbi:UDP-3-O-(3-hydroxymyristoyl)glucosamine N-acyltransferase [Desulfoscipio sp. XC116]|uniref:UDP-3-O-(3-hydroxymyristoyl)glucosamine N-acyltransferase n=1 Tax=Desulfoscipio sp. XC116 TaxID=3144975 RepID=UPI00325BF2EF